MRLFGFCAGQQPEYTPVQPPWYSWLGHTLAVHNPCNTGWYWIPIPHYLKKFYFEKNNSTQVDLQKTGNLILILKIKWAFYVLSTLLVLFDVFSELLLYNSGKHCSHFPSEETEAQTACVTFLRS